MKLLTKAIENRFAKLGAQDVENPTIICKLFNPTGEQTWYAISYDGTDFFGYVTGFGDDELGYFNRQELEQFKGRFGLGIERDLWFSECKLSDIK